MQVLITVSRMPFLAEAKQALGLNNKLLIYLYGFSCLKTLFVFLSAKLNLSVVIMARMHTGRKGKAKSRKPEPESVNVPQDFSKGGIEKIIVEYAKKGTHQALIGQMLKEKHNVPYIKQYFGKRLGIILKENKAEGDFPQDMLDLFKRAVVMRRHIAKNHNDVHNKVRLGRVEAKIWRLTKYYKRTGALQADWKYEPDKVALMIKS